MEGLVARPVEGLLETRDAREPLRVLIASLAPGGAERIVLEWTGAERARGRDVEIAVLHPRRTALAPPHGVRVRTRGSEAPEAFLQALAEDLRASPSPVSTHLVTDDLLGILWRAGVATVPVVHNARAGWRNDPAAWPPRHVPCAVACAEAVRREMIDAGCRVPVVTLRHRPRVGMAAVDPGARRRIRDELRIPDSTFLVGAVGAFKPQKDHARALEVVSRLARGREAALVILGGVLESSSLGELDRLLEAAVRLGFADRLRLPGFVTDVEPWLAACDALLNVSRFEGLSIAVQEALASGLPVVAADVGGQGEIAHTGLELVPSQAGIEDYAERLARHPVRAALEPRPFARAPRTWSLTLTAREPGGASALETLFVTANLNAGGAQRSLVNLAAALAGAHRFAIAVCGETTHAAFAASLAARGIEAFRLAARADDLAVAESLLAHAAARAARTVCFWNVAPGVKLLCSRFAPPGLKLIDVSPGRYAFEELESARSLGEAIDWTPENHYARLDTLVLKHDDPSAPRARRTELIRNGVAERSAAPPAASPRFLVAGRIAPSKRLEVIARALEILRGRLGVGEVHAFGVAEPRHAEYAAQLRSGAGEGFVWRGADFSLEYLGEGWTAAVVLGTHQGCPNAVLEAMAAGIPVVANASGGTGELVDAATGWLLPEDCSGQQLAAAMQAAWIDRQGRDARAAAALARARGSFSMESMAARYLEILAPDAREGRATIEA